MKLQQQQLPLPLFVCLLCQVLYRAFFTTQINCTARELLFGGLCAACLLAFGLFVLSLLGQGFVASSKKVYARTHHTRGVQTQADSFDVVQGAQSAQKRAIRAISATLCLLLLLGVVHGMVQQVQLYYRQFGAGALWVLLCACLVWKLHCAPHALLRCARLLLFFCVLASVAAALGLAAQSSWRNLSTEALTLQGLANGFWVGFGVYPEYLAIFVCAMQPIIVPASQVAPKQGSLLPILVLPFGAVAVQFFVVLCSELIFGVPQAGVGGFEFLRSWAFLRFSRFDGVVVLLWLLLSFFRLRFLCFLAQQANPFGAKRGNAKTKQARGNPTKGQVAQQEAKHRCDGATGGVV